MKYDKTKINDCLVIHLDLYRDKRGMFYESYNHLRYLKTFINTDGGPAWEGPGNPIGEQIVQSSWRQTNCSISHKGVVRGIHIAPFAKLVTCVSGYVWDVVVDMRKDSPTYLTWIGVDLMSDYPKQVYVPPGCGHGFMSFENGSVVTYSQTGLYDPKLETSVNWRDKKLNIYWPRDYDYILSPKDEEAPFI